MGLPKNYTQVPFKGKTASDKVRITAIGNSFPVPILRWLGQRIQRIAQLEQ